MEQVIANIAKMDVNGMRLELPKGEQFTNYPQVKKALIKAGGKYVKCGFVFTTCPQAIKDRLCGGEKIDDKKKFQFFPTPRSLAVRMVEMADIQESDRCLEPSAGQGAIADIIPFNNLTVVELDPVNHKHLIDKGHICYIRDFLTVTKGTFGFKFDKIVANPPFTKNQDIDHIMHMYTLLNSGGRIVTLSSQSWVKGSQKKQIAFRSWLNDLDAVIESIPEGTFRESGTSIATMLITIDKT